MSVIDRRQRRVFRVLWTEGRLSRSELHQRTGLTPNGVGTLAEAMLRSGLLRECPATAKAAGRPRVPLEVDPSKRHVLGLAIEPGRASICRLGLAGTVLERVRPRQCADPRKLIPTAAALLSEYSDQRTLGVGVSITGFVDPRTRTLLFSSAMKGGPAADLSPIFDAAGELPVVLENDMHALAARWLLTHRAHHQQDVLLVWIEDGRLGAAILVDGRPNRGCATGANDLGHTRFFVETERCFCGHTGCLERIVSSDFLARRDAANSSANNHSALPDRAARFEAKGLDPSMDEMNKYLACALSNAINFVRPHRLVLVSPFTRHPLFAQALFRQVRDMVLPQLVDRVQLDLWDEPGAGSAETAAWLAMAELLYGGWNQSESAAMHAGG
ncbi:MAG TPA: ROK family protein [Tepidisphaeraceae bacterium]|jgi:predicted NBD/HSP70 family sugar kinase